MLFLYFPRFSPMWHAATKIPATTCLPSGSCCRSFSQWWTSQIRNPKLWPFLEPGKLMINGLVLGFLTNPLRWKSPVDVKQGRQDLRTQSPWQTSKTKCTSVLFFFFHLFWFIFWLLCCISVFPNWWHSPVDFIEPDCGGPPKHVCGWPAMLICWDVKLNRTQIHAVVACCLGFHTFSYQLWPLHVNLGPRKTEKVGCWFKSSLKQPDSLRYMVCSPHWSVPDGLPPASAFHSLWESLACKPCNTVVAQSHKGSAGCYAGGKWSKYAPSCKVQKWETKKKGSGMLIHYLEKEPSKHQPCSLIIWL